MRNKTKEVKIGGITIGGNNKIAIQSMCNTKTSDVEATIKQINELAAMGCDIVRVAVLNMEDAKAIKDIKKQISIPLVADIHFDYKLALEAIDAGIDKLRINPGNIGSIEKVQKVVLKCKEKHIPIRIGVNAGSLEKNLPQNQSLSDMMIESAKRHVDLLESLDFYDIVISLKASNIQTAALAYEKASLVFDYPLHIGITEAGTLYSGNIKSAIGLGILLNQGIGDTIRVSLSASPVEEVKTAKEILANFGLYDKPELISCPTCGRTKYNMFKVVDEIEAFLQTIGNKKIVVAVMGCVVNGPGEASRADIGVAGGKGCAILFKKGKIIKNLLEDEIVSCLKQEIMEMIK